MMFTIGSRLGGTALAVATLIVVFMAGALTSAAVIEVLNARTQGDVARSGPGGQARDRGSRPPRPFRGGPEVMMSRFMTERLGLTQEQQEQLREILTRRQEESEAILEELRPRLQASLDSTLAEIREILTPEQRERFEELNSEGRSQLFERFPGPRPGFPDRRGPRGR